MTHLYWVPDMPRSKLSSYGRETRLAYCGHTVRLAEIAEKRNECTCKDCLWKWKARHYEDQQ